MASIAFAAGFTETSACHAWGMPCNWIDLGFSLDELAWDGVFSVWGHHSTDIYRLQTHVGPCGIPFYRVQMGRWVPRGQHCSRFHRDLSLLCLLLGTRRCRHLRHALGVYGFRMFWVNSDVFHWLYACLYNLVRAYIAISSIWNGISEQPIPPLQYVTIFSLEMFRVEKLCTLPTRSFVTMCIYNIIYT